MFFSVIPMSFFFKDFFLNYKQKVNICFVRIYYMVKVTDNRKVLICVFIDLSFL
jgi:hypothetical protein